MNPAWFGGPRPQPRLELVCPSCGMVVIRDDAAQAIMHEDPECAWFAAVMALGPKARVERVEGLDQVDAHLQRLAAEVAARKGGP